MKQLITIGAIFVTILFASNSKAEWSFNELNTTNSSKPFFKTIRTLDNSQQIIEYKGKSCLVGETLFQRMNNNHVAEFRKIECQITEDVTVTELVTCKQGLIEMSHIAITIKGQYFSPVLSCDLR